MDEAVLRLDEAVPLLHALVARAADDCAVRVLFIKGPVLHLQDLRVKVGSVDVDVWADPGRIGVLIDHLAELGWDRHGELGTSSMLVRHSVVCTHERWPCEVDVHNRFPGFFRSPQDLFELLWERRSSVIVAQTAIPCPDRLDHALVAALHYLRDPGHPVQAQKLTTMVDLLDQQLTPDERQTLGERAAALGAADTARSFTATLGVADIGLGTTSALDLAAWDERSHPARPAVAWLIALRRAPVQEWPMLIGHAVRGPVSDTQVIAEGGEPTDPKTRIRRLMRGLRALPGAVREVRRLERRDRP